MLDFFQCTACDAQLRHFFHTETTSSYHKQVAQKQHQLIVDVMKDIKVPVEEYLTVPLNSGFGEPLHTFVLLFLTLFFAVRQLDITSITTATSFPYLNNIIMVMCYDHFRENAKLCYF